MRSGWCCLALPSPAGKGGVKRLPQKVAGDGLGRAGEDRGAGQRSGAF